MLRLSRNESQEHFVFEASHRRWLALWIISHAREKPITRRSQKRPTEIQSHRNTWIAKANIWGRGLRELKRTTQTIPKSIRNISFSAKFHFHSFHLVISSHLVVRQSVFSRQILSSSWMSTPPATYSDINNIHTHRGNICIAECCLGCDKRWWILLSLLRVRLHLVCPCRFVWRHHWLRDVLTADSRAARDWRLWKKKQTHTHTHIRIKSNHANIAGQEMEKRVETSQAKPLGIQPLDVDRSSPECHQTGNCARYVSYTHTHTHTHTNAETSF